MQSPFKRKIVGANPTGGTISFNRILARPSRPALLNIWRESRILNDWRESWQRIRFSGLALLWPDHTVAPGLSLLIRERAWMIGESHARIVENLQHSHWYRLYVETKCFAGDDGGLKAGDDDDLIRHSSSMYLRKRTDFRIFKCLRGVIVAHGVLASRVLVRFQSRCHFRCRVVQE